MRALGILVVAELLLLVVVSSQPNNEGQQQSKQAAPEITRENFQHELSHILGRTSTYVDDLKDLVKVLRGSDSLMEAEARFKEAFIGGPVLYNDAVSFAVKAISHLWEELRLHIEGINDGFIEGPLTCSALDHHVKAEMKDHPGKPFDKQVAFDLMVDDIECMAGILQRIFQCSESLDRGVEMSIEDASQFVKDLIFGLFEIRDSGLHFFLAMFDVFPEYLPLPEISGNSIQQKREYLADQLVNLVLRGTESGPPPPPPTGNGNPPPPTGSGPPPPPPPPSPTGNGNPPPPPGNSGNRRQLNDLLKDLLRRENNSPPPPPTGNGNPPPPTGSGPPPPSPTGNGNPPPPPPPGNSGIRRQLNDLLKDLLRRENNPPPPPPPTGNGNPPPPTGSGPPPPPPSPTGNGNPPPPPPPGNSGNRRQLNDLLKDLLRRENNPPPPPPTESGPPPPPPPSPTGNGNPPPPPGNSGNRRQLNDLLKDLLRRENNPPPPPPPTGNGNPPPPTGSGPPPPPPTGSGPPPPPPTGDGNPTPAPSNKRNVKKRGLGIAFRNLLRSIFH
ncbi:basic salivary proline-rich protein 2-like [Haliotis asinina]|uniref:basic salivary proline-rich protein 2-like n=1 Tax=Haliotis asinina TaxID=109174 RepID=UPI003531FEDD